MYLGAEVEAEGASGAVVRSVIRRVSWPGGGGGGRVAGLAEGWIRSKNKERGEGRTFNNRSRVLVVGDGDRSYIADIKE